MRATIPQRRTVRLRGYDYASAGMYFVTICTLNRALWFGEIANAKMHLNPIGQIVDETWAAMFRFFDNANTWIVMPNHLHGIIVIEDSIGDVVAGKSLGRLVGAFKTATTKQINEIRVTPGAILWQRGFYEHIIRDGRAFENIAAYIEDNPSQWADDPENPASHHDGPRLRANSRVR